MTADLHDTLGTVREAGRLTDRDLDAMLRSDDVAVLGLIGGTARRTLAGAGEPTRAKFVEWRPDQPIPTDETRVIVVGAAGIETAEHGLAQLVGASVLGRWLDPTDLARLAWTTDGGARPPGVRRTLARLVAAGLTGLTERGGESLTGAGSLSGDEWTGLIREAHRHRLATVAGLRIGPADEPRATLDHLARLRAFQEETSGFAAVCLSAEPGVGAVAWLRGVAAARGYLDNIPSVEIDPAGLAPMLVQLALRGGADGLRLRQVIAR